MLWGSGRGSAGGVAGRELSTVLGVMSAGVEWEGSLLVVGAGGGCGYRTIRSSQISLTATMHQHPTQISWLWLVWCGRLLGCGGEHLGLWYCGGERPGLWWWTSAGVVAAQEAASLG